MLARKREGGAALEQEAALLNEQYRESARVLAQAAGSMSPQLLAASWAPLLQMKATADELLAAPPEDKALSALVAGLPLPRASRLRESARGSSDGTEQVDAWHSEVESATRGIMLLQTKSVLRSPARLLLRLAPRVSSPRLPQTIAAPVAIRLVSTTARAPDQRRRA